MHPDLQIPSAGPIYSFNEANFHDFDELVKRHLDALKEGSSSTEQQGIGTTTIPITRTPTSSQSQPSLLVLQMTMEQVLYETDPFLILKLNPTLDKR
jgi:hypothetical protein